MALTVIQNGNVLNAVATVVAGTPIPLATGPKEVKIEHLFIQMLSGGSKKGLVYRGFEPNTAPAGIAAAAGQPAELAPATADAPGGEYEFDPGPYGSADLRTFALDGANTGDTILIDARLKV
jgi:hypothetical protein